MMACKGAAEFLVLKAALVMRRTVTPLYEASFHCQRGDFLPDGAKHPSGIDSTVIADHHACWAKRGIPSTEKMGTKFRGVFSERASAFILDHLRFGFEGAVESGLGHKAELGSRR